MCVQTNEEGNDKKKHANKTDQEKIESQLKQENMHTHPQTNKQTIKGSRQVLSWLPTTMKVVCVACGELSDRIRIFELQLPKNFNAECSDDREKISGLTKYKILESPDLKENNQILNAHWK